MGGWCRRPAAAFSSGQSSLRPPGVSRHGRVYNWHTTAALARSSLQLTKQAAASSLLKTPATQPATAALIDREDNVLSNPCVFSQVVFDLLLVVSDSCTTQMQPPTVPYSTAATMQLLPVMMMTMPELNPPTCDQQCPGTLGRRSSNYKGNHQCQNVTNI